MEDKFLGDIYLQSIKDLNSFYGINWNYNLPKIFIVDDRKTIDSLKGRTTESWLVGWSDGENVYLLNKENYEKESSHKYNPDQYSALVKHELSHTFYNILSCGQDGPVWLAEGVAIYTAGQIKFKKKPTNFINFLKFYAHGGGEVYGEAGFVVELLLKKFGKKKLLTLIKNLKNYKTKKLFDSAFKKRYGFLPNYKSFNILLKEVGL